MSEYVGLYMETQKANIYLSNNSKKYLLDRELSVEIIENGVILPSKAEDKNSGESKKLWSIGGVINDHGAYVKESELGHLWGGGYEYNVLDEETIDEPVLFLGPFVAHWGHFICDEISRLWYFVKHPGAYKIAYCSWLFGEDTSEWKISGNYLELLNLLSIQEEQLININKPTRFRRIIIPELSFIATKYYTTEYKNMINTIVSNLNNFEIPRLDKIYFTRQNFYEAKNKEFGENDIVELFRTNGYTILSPEDLSVKEQIFYFQNCTSIAMISGTISHNLIFSSQGLNAIILNKIGIVNAYQILVDQIAGAQITYIDTYFKGLPVLFGEGPFWIGINKYIKKWGRDNNWEMKRQEYNIIKGIIWYLNKYKEKYVDNKRLQSLLKSQQEYLNLLKKKDI